VLRESGTFERDDNSVIEAIWQQEAGVFGPVH